MNDLFRRFGQSSAAPSPAPAAPVQAAQQGAPDFQAMLDSLKANPAAMLQKAGLNVPQEMMGNPRQMVSHLMATGQVRNPGAVHAFMRQIGVG